MTLSETARRWSIRTALAYLGTPYKWGGDDPSGFDCSGLVVECLQSSGQLENLDFTADGLWRRFRDRQVATPKAGCLIFRLNSSGQADHVVLCLDQWFMIGAAGGDRQTRSLTDAAQANAFVKIRPIVQNLNRRRICDPFME